MLLLGTSLAGVLRGDGRVEAEHSRARSEITEGPATSRPFSFGTSGTVSKCGILLSSGAKMEIPVWSPTRKECHVAITPTVGARSRSDGRSTLR
jgi:hypothetical protein